MLAVLSVIVVVVISLLVVRVATVALVLTGISRDLARFQARSAFTGAGFTTMESEEVVRHPVRRRIIMLLMLLGNAGLVTAAATLIASFAAVDQEGGLLNAIWFRIVVLIGGLSILWTAATSKWLDRRLNTIITWALARWTSIEVRDYAALLHLAGEWAVSELRVEPDDWLADQSLARLNLNEEGVLVLGIERASGEYIGAPRGKSMVRANDTLLLYGRQKVLADLDERRRGPEGNRKHVEAVVEQMNVEREDRAKAEEESVRTNGVQLDKNAPQPEQVKRQ